MAPPRADEALPGRAGAMAVSIRSTAASLGVTAPHVDRVLQAFRSAMRPRLLALADDRHPAFLHPGRSILILLRDLACADPDALSLAALIESEDPGLEPAPGAGPGPIEVARSLPRPGDDALMERLVGLSHPTAAAVLAERLDQLRHYHLRPDLEPVWRARHEEVVDAWLPFARRVDARLGRRYEHWVRTFRRRIR